MENVQKILKAHSSSTPSKWKEDAEWRRNNRKWLKRSRQIAMAVMDCIDNMGMSQKTLAKRMEVSPQYISKLLKGTQNLSLETISKLEEILAINILVVQNFNANQQVIPVTDWQQPTFTDIMSAGENRQAYKEISTLTYCKSECTDAA